MVPSATGRKTPDIDNIIIKHRNKETIRFKVLNIKFTANASEKDHKITKINHFVA